MKTRSVNGLYRTKCAILFFDKLSEIELRVGPGNSLRLDMPLAQILAQEVEEAICDLEAAEAQTEEDDPRNRETDEHV